MRTSRRVWSIKAGCVAAACAAMMLPINHDDCAAVGSPVRAGAAPAPAQAPPNPTAAATAADHRNMMEQLGITALRPGPSGNESAPNHANYDEALANPFPNLPEVLTLKNGRKVTSAAVWWKQRRPEIVEDVRPRSPRTRAEERAEGHVGGQPHRDTSRSADGRSSARSSSATSTTRPIPDDRPSTSR